MYVSTAKHQRLGRMTKRLKGSSDLTQRNEIHGTMTNCEAMKYVPLANILQKYSIGSATIQRMEKIAYILGILPIPNSNAGAIYVFARGNLLGIFVYINRSMVYSKVGGPAQSWFGR